MPSLVHRRGPLVATAVSVAAIVTAASALMSFTPAVAADSSSCAASQVDVVAHPDDDLLFQSPDLLNAIDAGTCVATAYVTAGDDGQTSTYWQNRELGVQAAYAQMAGVANSWTDGTMDLAGKTVATKTLTAKPSVVLVFFQLPDGGLQGTGFSSTGDVSLKQLDQGTIPSISSIGAIAATYTKPQLIASLRALMEQRAATIVHTQDYTGTYGDDTNDHPDHRAVAFFTRTASNQYATPHTLVGYEDYETQNEPATVSGADLTGKSDAFYAYTPYDSEICQTAAACAGSYEASWLQRQYVADSTTSGPDTATTNLAMQSTAVASSQNTSAGQTASAAIDGVVDGYTSSLDFSDPTTAEKVAREWVSSSGTGVGESITLTWPSTVSIGRVTLHDRINTDDQITSGRLTFSDGTSVSVPSLANDGTGTDVSFPSVSTTSLTFTIDSVSTTTNHAGLAEIEAYQGTADGGSTPTPTATPTTMPTDLPTATPTTTPTATPTETPTATPTATPTDSPTATPSATPTTTPSNSPTTTPTQTPEPTQSSAPTQTSAPAPTQTANPAPAPTQTTTPAPVPALPKEKGIQKETLKDSTLTTKQFGTTGAGATITGLTAGKKYRVSYTTGESGAVITTVTANAKGVITGTWKPNTKAAPALAGTGTFQLRLQGVQTSLDIAKTFTVKYDSHLTWRTAHRSGKKVTLSVTATHATTKKDVAWSHVKVLLQKRVGSTWKTVATLTTSSKGVATAVEKVGRSRWRAVISSTDAIWNATARTISK